MGSGVDQGRSGVLPRDFEEEVQKIEEQVRADLRARDRWADSFEPIVHSYAVAVVTARRMESELPQFAPGSPEFMRLARRIERTRSQVVKLQAALGLSAAAREREAKPKKAGSLLELIRETFAAEPPRKTRPKGTCPFSWELPPEGCLGPTIGARCDVDKCPR